MRNHQLISGLVLALALMIGVTAAAQTSSSQSPTQGQATSPSQTAPATQPSSQPQASPQSSTGSQSQNAPEGQAGTQSQTPSEGQAPAATKTPSQQQPGSAATGGHGQAAGRTSSTEDELQLTDDQKAKLQPIIQEEMVQIDAVRTDNSLSMEQKQAKVAQIKKDHFPKIEAILTPEQRKKLADMQEKAKQQHQTPGGQGSSQQPPQ